MLNWWNKYVFNHLFFNIMEAKNKVIEMDAIVLNDLTLNNFASRNLAKVLPFQLQENEEVFLETKSGFQITLGM